MRFVAEEDLTPMFRAVKVKDGWFGTRVNGVGLGARVDYSGMLEPVA